MFTPLVLPLIMVEKVEIKKECKQKNLRWTNGGFTGIFTPFNYTINLFLHLCFTRLNLFITLFTLFLIITLFFPLFPPLIRAELTVLA